MCINLSLYSSRDFSHHLQLKCTDGHLFRPILAYIHVHTLIFFMHYTVSDTPIDLSLTRLRDHVHLSWSGSSPRYEVFYSLSGSDDIQSAGVTTDKTYNVTSRLTQGQTYEFFVVSYGNDGTPVLPSVNSNIMTLSK